MALSRSCQHGQLRLQFMMTRSIDLEFTKGMLNFSSTIRALDR